jgi:hypothetical protein
MKFDEIFMGVLLALMIILQVMMVARYMLWPV